MTKITEVTIVKTVYDQAVEKLNEGKYVGCECLYSSTNIYKRRIHNNKTYDKNGTIRSSVLNEQSISICGYTNFVYFDNEFEFWKWFLT